MLVDRDACCRCGNRSRRRRACATSSCRAAPTRSRSPADGLRLHDYEALLARRRAAGDAPDPDERTAAAMCYTTGTTGKPKGVLYSHRALVLHTFASRSSSCMGIARARRRAAGRADVPRQRVGPALRRGDGRARSSCCPGRTSIRRASSICSQRERVTITGGVPTIWMGVLQYLDANPGAFDLSAHPRDGRRRRRRPAGADRSVRAAARPARRPRLGHDRDGAARHRVATCPPRSARRRPTTNDTGTARSRGGPSPFVEIRARNEDGLVPWDGATMGELEVRGPWVAAAYYNRDDCGDRFTDDGWFRTGDIVTIDERGDDRASRIARRI